MNRLWIGIGLLVILLAGGIGLLWGSVVFFGEFSQNIETAGEIALTGDWSLAAEKTNESRTQWEKWFHFWSAFTDHAPMEQMQDLFSQLEIYQANQRTIEFAAVCRSLAQIAEAIAETHNLRWWSIL